MPNYEDKITETTDALAEEGSHLKEDVQAYAKEAWETVQDQTGRAVREGSIYVRENPVPIAFAAFGLGLVAGLILSHREKPSLRKKYIDEPLEHSHGAVAALASALNTLLHRNLHSASSAAEGLVENVGDSLRKNIEPFADAARRAGRKLGL